MNGKKTQVTKPRITRHPAWIISTCLLTLTLLGGSLTYTWLRHQRPATIERLPGAEIAVSGNTRPE